MNLPLALLTTPAILNTKIYIFGVNISMYSDTKPPSYGKLHGLFYDATKTYAPEREVQFFASFMKKEGRILEAMCGSGRLQIPLIQQGFIVDGVDNSPSMLARFKARCATLQLTPDIYEQSLEELSLPHLYATVTIAVASFQLITDRAIALAVLKKLHAHMLSQADLLIDIFVPDRTMDPRSVRIARVDDTTSVRQTSRYIFDEQTKIADAYCLYELIVNGLVTEQENELIALTWYSDEELTQLLEDAGFKVIKFYDETFRSIGPSRIVHAKKL